MADIVVKREPMEADEERALDAASAVKVEIEIDPAELQSEHMYYDAAPVKSECDADEPTDGSAAMPELDPRDYSVTGNHFMDMCPGDGEGERCSKTEEEEAEPPAHITIENIHEHQEYSKRSQFAAQSTEFANAKRKGYANQVHSQQPADSLNRKVCKLCGKKLKIKQLIHKCRTNADQPKTLYECTMCSYKCADRSSLRGHIFTHTGEKPYECSVCKIKSASKSHMRRHMRIHTGEKPYQCTICDYKCSYNFALQCHMRTHTGEKPYECTVCNLKFTNKFSLSSHARTHTGEKPFKCSVCDYKSSQQTHLKSHMRTHTGEKPYECSVCKSKFSKKSVLNNHMRIHTGEKPYECTVCNYKCTQQSALKRHMKRHPEGKPDVSTVPVTAESEVPVSAESKDSNIVKIEVEK